MGGSGIEMHLAMGQAKISLFAALSGEGRMTPEDELLAVFASWRRRVDELAVWSAGGQRLHHLLQMAIARRAAETKFGVVAIGFPWESLMDRVLEWHYRYPLGTGECTEAAVDDAVYAAMQSLRIEPMEASIRTGAFRVKKTREAFRIVYRWDVSFEVADMYLERQVSPEPIPEPTEAELQWASGQPRETLNAFAPPTDILQSAMRRNAVAVYGWRSAYEEPSLPDDFELGDGLTVGTMASVLTGLMAMVELGELAHARIRRLGTTLCHAPYDVLVEWLARACNGLGRETIATAIQRLMAGPGRSLRTSLLVSNQSLVTILPLTMFPRAIDAIVLRTAASDPALYGPIGKRQGERAKAWALWLGQIPHVEVTERLKLREPGGKTIGDLDLLAVDLESGAGLVLELKWPIDALTLPEVMKTDDNILSACLQLGKVRRLIQDEGTPVKMPPGWPAFDEVNWTWGIGTPKQLYTGQLPEKEMFATSLRYVKSLGAPESLNAVINVLRNPDLPRLGHQYTIERMTVQLDQYVIHSDSIHILDAPWKPRLG